VGLTGNVAAGKSTVAALFRRWGATLIDADEIVRELQAPTSPVLAAIAARFGSEVLAADGSVDRGKLGPIVFDDARARRELEAIVHPAVYRAIAAGLQGFERLGDPIAIVDVPLLYESGAEKDFGRVIVTACPPELQIARLVHRGLSEDAARQRLAAQWPTEKKAARADFVIQTDGTFEETDRQVAEVLKTLLGARG